MAVTQTPEQRIAALEEHVQELGRNVIGLCNHFGLVPENEGLDWVDLGPDDEEGGES
jgi:hypothetical protein